jgi:ADP-ribosyl-[dinitrogen reductase] hydrolase
VKETNGMSRMNSGRCGHRTSTSHPLEIASVEGAAGRGRIGITFCPGKKQASAWSGSWDRDLCVDLDAVEKWGAAVVVTLLEQQEIEALSVERLGEEVRRGHMEWMHLPIRDVSVPGPEFEEEWRSAGESLRARLRCGFDVVVHCKGGLGRAGTIAARLMVELGRAPAEAIRAVREVRPGALETAAQVDHVMKLAKVPEPLPSRERDAILDRAKGALLGLAVGDAVGTTLEFKARDTYPPLTDMVGGGPFGLRPGEWTDDTSMALALADSLLHDPDLDERDLMRRFSAWRAKGTYSSNGRCFDIGMTVGAALTRFAQTGNPIAGSRDPHHAGNGSLMRLAPVAIRHWRRPEKLRDVAARQSATTHGAAEAVNACMAYAELLAEAIAGESKANVLRPRENRFRGRVGTIIAGSWRGKRRCSISSSGYVCHSLEAAIWCVARTDTFRDAVLLAANLGGDADTTAAIAGQLAGALYGVGGIPDTWLRRLSWEKSILQIAGRLADGDDEGESRDIQLLS